MRLLRSRAWHQGCDPFGGCSPHLFGKIENWGRSGWREGEEGNRYTGGEGGDGMMICKKRKEYI